MMSYRFVDDIVALDLGERSRIEARMTFAPGHDGLSGPSGGDRVPNSLVLELLAMTGGHLLFERLGRQRLPLLLKVRDCRFENRAEPGVPLTAWAKLRGLSVASDDPLLAEIDGGVFAGSARIASGRLLYACVTIPKAALADAGGWR